MAKERHLNNAPIVEAVINIRVKNPSIKAEAFSQLKEKLPDYPDVKSLRAFEFGGKFEKEKVDPRFKDWGIVGYTFRSGDGKNVAQFKTNEFVFSRLHPYTEWETVLGEAKKLWGYYTAIASPEIVTRIAVRYINKMDIKLPFKDFKEYLEAPPEIPESLPQGISEFLTRVVIHENEATANIVQTMGKSAKPGYVEILLDIDVFKIKRAGIERFEDMWPEFEELRSLKNRIFFSSITEKAARLFK